MAVPTWSPGQVLVANDVNNWFVPLVGYSTADVTRANTTTAAASLDLTIPIAVSAFYRFECDLSYTGSSTALQGLKATFSVPTGTFLRYHLTGIANTSGNPPAVGNTWLASSTIVLGTNSGVNSGASLSGTLFTGSTSGSITLLWAQQVSEATGVTLQQQSNMVLTRIG